MFKNKKLILSVAVVAVASVASACLFEKNDQQPTKDKTIIAMQKAQTVSTDEDDDASEEVALMPEADDELAIKDITAQVPYGHRKANRTAKDVDIIVIHSNYHVPSFSEPRDTFSTEGCIAQFKHYDVAAHYMVCRDATILRMVKEKDVAWQAGKSSLPGTNRTMLNPTSIGIEVVSTKTNGPTEAQYKALIALVKDICSRYEIKYLVRHADIAPTRRDDPWGFDWNWFCDQIQLYYPNIKVFRHKVKDLDHLS